MNTNKTFENLKDIIASDLNLAIELIKSQEINVEDFVDYLMRFDEIKIEGKYIERYNHLDYNNMIANQVPLIYNGWCLTIIETQYETESFFKQKLINYINYLCQKK